MTTSIIVVCSFLWYLPHLYSTLSLSCRDHFNWWFYSAVAEPSLLEVSSLLAVALFFWLYADIIRPKPVRIPVTLRAFQMLLATTVVVLSVFQWGFFSPRSDEARIYRFFQQEVSGWPVIGRFIVQPVIPMEPLEVSALDYQTDPAFATVRQLETEYYETFVAHGRSPHFGMYEGQLECEAAREIERAWLEALETYAASREAKHIVDPRQSPH
ncbi:MAG: hypothetical protein U9P68_03240 [Pseudomonadota bacterium]|nr:hypothetical protein [Pseudomonadota bacterium]